ncbi:MAG: T9SS type A sorting domain-containing protein [Flavobacteriales bacterium]|nr:T9SS type A sorting domain-containing protein [Flavobacteriales bacterium]
MKLLNALGSVLLAAAISAPSVGLAQQQVDIGLFRNGDKLEVRVRPASDFNGIFSSLVFTIRWDRSSGAALGALRQEGAPAQYMPVMKSGAVRESGTFNYQVYAGFGVSPLEGLETSWRAGQEVVLATISVTGKGEFELVNDAFTAEPATNANFYVSLGGRDQTGVIYKGLSTAEEDGTVTILPNPNNGQFTFFFSVNTPTDVTVEVVNALGQSIFNDTLRNFEGTYRKEMDLTSMSSGLYYLKLKRNGETTTHKIVYR